MPGICNSAGADVMASRQTMPFPFGSDILTLTSYCQLLPARSILPPAGVTQGGAIRLTTRCKIFVAGWAVWRLPPALRAYVSFVIAAAAAIGIAAALTSWRARDALLFGLLVFFGAAVIEFTRRTAEPAGLIKEVHAAWQLPMALLLPPVYCLIAPLVTIGLLQLRTRRTIAHRRVFTAAANGLSLGAASVAFHALPATTSHPLTWLLAVIGCALL